MYPLRERSSKFLAKVIIFSLWVFSTLLALPMLFFFEFTYVFDESNGGVKPFCTLAALLRPEHDPDPDSDNATLALDDDDVSAFTDIKNYETYNFLLSIVQYVLPLFVISFAYARMGTKLWLTKTPGVAQQKRDRMILVNKKKVR